MCAQIWMDRMRLATSASVRLVSRWNARPIAATLIVIGASSRLVVACCHYVHSSCLLSNSSPSPYQYHSSPIQRMNRTLANCRPNNTIENNTQHSILCGACGAVLVHVRLPAPTGRSVVIHEQDNEQRNNGGRREGRSSTKRVVKLYK